MRLAKVEEVKAFSIVLLHKDMKIHSIRSDRFDLIRGDFTIAARVPMKGIRIDEFILVTSTFRDIICLVIGHKEWARRCVAVHFVTINRALIVSFPIENSADISSGVSLAYNEVSLPKSAISGDKQTSFDDVLDVRLKILRRLISVRHFWACVEGLPELRSERVDSILDKEYWMLAELLSIGSCIEFLAQNPFN